MARLWSATHGWRRPGTNLIQINTMNGVRHAVADISLPDLDFVHQNDGSRGSPTVAMMIIEWHCSGIQIRINNGIVLIILDWDLIMYLWGFL